MAKVKELDKPVKSAKTNKLIIPIISVIAVVFILALISNSNTSGFVSSGQSSPTAQAVVQPNCRDVQVPYETTETYTDTEPYTAQECSQVSIKFIVENYVMASECLESNTCGHYTEVCTERNWLGNCVKYSQQCDSWLCSRMNMGCDYTIKNIDDTGGVWSYIMKLTDLDTNAEFNMGTKSLYIQPTLSGTLSWRYSTNQVNDRFVCSITNSDPPEKTECHDVIKYRDVTKTRTVTKVRTETVCD